MRTAETLREGVRNFRFTWEDRVFRPGRQYRCRADHPPTTRMSPRSCRRRQRCGAAKEGGRKPRPQTSRRTTSRLMRRRREMQWAARINAALEEGRFELYRMAIQPLQAGRSRSALTSCLLRLKDEGGRIVAPNDFIAAPSATESPRRSIAG